MEKSDIDAILRTAHNTVINDRGPTHGSLENSFQMIADFWSVYLTNTNRNNDNGSVRVSPADVAFMMDLLKTARAVHGKPALDHFVDKCGYSAIAGSLSGAVVSRPVAPSKPSVGLSNPASSPEFSEAVSNQQIAALTEKYPPRKVAQPTSDAVDTSVAEALKEALSKEIK